MATPPTSHTTSKRQPEPFESLRCKVRHWTRAVARHYFGDDDAADISERSMGLLDRYVAARAAATNNHDSHGDAIDSWSYQLAAAASISIVAASRETTSDERCPRSEPSLSSSSSSLSSSSSREAVSGGIRSSSSSLTLRRRRQVERRDPPPGEEDAAPRIAHRGGVVPAVITPSSSYEDLSSLAASSANSTSMAAKMTGKRSRPDAAGLRTQRSSSRWLDRSQLARMSRGRFAVCDVKKMEGRIISALKLDAAPEREEEGFGLHEEGDVAEQQLRAVAQQLSCTLHSGDCVADRRQATMRQIDSASSDAPTAHKRRRITKG